MNGRRAEILACIRTALVVALLSSCGGDSRGRQELESPVAGELPVLRVEDLARFARRADGPLIDGADAVSSQNAVAEGTAIRLTPATGGFAYAMWQLSPGLLDVGAVQMKISTSPGGELWIGVGNYSSGSWDFSGPYLSGAPVAVMTPGMSRQSPTGSAYVVAVASGGEARVEQLALGLFMDFPAAGGSLMWDAQRMQALTMSQDAGAASVRAGVIAAAEYYRGWAVPESSEWWGPHQNGVMALAVAWRLTGEQKYLGKLSDYLDCVARFENLRGGRDGAEDLDLGVSLTNISVAYNWSKGELSAETCSLLEALLFKEGQYANTLFQARKTRYYWNHAHYVATGLYAAGCVLDDYTPLAAVWRMDVSAFYDRMETLQDKRGDVVYPEGCAYAGAVYYLVAQYRELRLGFDGAVPSRSWWSKLPAYFRSTLRPDMARSIRLADDDGVFIYPPENALRYAATYTGNPDAQSLAVLLRETCGQQKETFWLFAWQAALLTDPRVSSATGTRPLSELFEDSGLAVTRDSWDAGASLLAVRSGKPGGSVYNSYLAAHPLDQYGGLGHLQADNNSLSWWKGSTCLLSDYGFEDLKLTSQHNTITLSGYGQMGESGEWWGWGWSWKRWGYGGAITRSERLGGDAYIAEMRCDDDYVPNAKLAKFRRRVVWLDPNVLVVQDKVETTAPMDVEVNWQTELGTWQLLTSEAIAAGRLHCRAIGLQPSGRKAQSLSIDDDTEGRRLQTVFTSVDGEVDLAHVLWDASSAEGWVLRSASSGSLTFSDGLRELILGVDAARITVRGYRALDFPCSVSLRARSKRGIMRATASRLVT
jgi:Heparinase II/III-like protein